MSRRKPRLNQRQKQWVQQFTQSRPHARINEIRTDLSGSRIVIIEWHTRIQLPLIVGTTDPGTAHILHELQVKLTRTGKVCYPAPYQARFLYPRCSYPHLPVSPDPATQVALPLPEVASILPPPHPLPVKPKRQSRQPKPHQYQLPLGERGR